MNPVGHSRWSLIPRQHDDLLAFRGKFFGQAIRSATVKIEIHHRRSEAPSRGQLLGLRELADGADHRATGL